MGKERTRLQEDLLKLYRPQDNKRPGNTPTREQVGRYIQEQERKGKKK